MVKRRRGKGALSAVGIVAALVAALVQRVASPTNVAHGAPSQAPVSVGQEVHGKGVHRERVQLLYWADGDTLKVQRGEDRESVRLIGIDTPESHPNDRAKRLSRDTGESITSMVARGKRAAKFAAQLVQPGDTLTLEYDVTQRDHFGRLLAYVYREDGVMVQEEIIRGGYATPLAVPPNTRNSERFNEAYRDAVAHERGLWGARE